VTRDWKIQNQIPHPPAGGFGMTGQMRERSKINGKGKRNQQSSPCLFLTIKRFDFLSIALLCVLCGEKNCNL